MEVRAAGERKRVLMLNGTYCAYRGGEGGHEGHEGREEE
jgi:hypothetical protein